MLPKRSESEETKPNHHTEQTIQNIPTDQIAINDYAHVHYQFVTISHIYNPKTSQEINWSLPWF